MKKIILFLLILFTSWRISQAQFIQLVNYADSSTTTDTVSGYWYTTLAAIKLDTDSVYIDISQINFRGVDSNKVIYVYGMTDTLKRIDTNAVNLWKDSGKTHPVKVEFRYIPGPSTLVAWDTIPANGAGGAMWISIFDSLKTQAIWQWKPMKILPISRWIQLRITDINTQKKGKNSGKWVRIKIYALRWE